MKNPIIESINTLLVQRPDIKVFKTLDRTKLGLHRYSFSFFDKSQNVEINGSGADFKDDIAVMKSWGEFVERYSFKKINDKSIANSNGFASHSNFPLACESALAELIERDVFLSSWLLKFEAIHLTDKNYFKNSKLKILHKLGINVKIGIIGYCMGFYVGIAFIFSIKDQKFAIATTAKKDLKLIALDLTTQAFKHVYMWQSPKCPKEIKDIPANTQPIDHLKFYLKTGQDKILPKFLINEGPLRVFPDFSYKIKNLTGDNEFSKMTNYSVVLASSQYCQNLWFGETCKKKINIDRIREIAKKKVTYEELNFDLHPLA